MQHTVFVSFAALVLVLGCCVAFPSDMPTTFKVQGAIQVAFQQNSYQPYNHVAAGAATTNVMGFIENPSTNPNALITVGLTVPGSVLLGISDPFGGPLAAVKVQDPQGVAHFSNQSVRAAAWDKSMCAFGSFVNNDVLENDFPFYIDWMFWNVWNQKGVYVGNETVNGVPCFVFEVQANHIGNYMMLWVNQQKPQAVMWSISYWLNRQGGYFAHVLVDNWTPGPVNQSSLPVECRDILAPVAASHLLERKQRQQAAVFAKETRKSGIRSHRFQKAQSPVSGQIDIGAILADGRQWLRDVYDMFH